MGSLDGHSCQASAGHSVAGSPPSADVAREANGPGTGSGTALRPVPRPRELITVRPATPSDSAAQCALLGVPAPAGPRLFAAGMLVLDDATHVQDESAGTRLVALRGAFPTPQLVGIGRLCVDPDGMAGEFGLLVHAGARRRGVGRLLLEALLADGRRRGLLRLRCAASFDSAPMLALAHACRFQSLPAVDGSAELVCTLAPCQRCRW